MVRIKFKVGEQRKFLELCRDKLDAPSVVSLLQFGIDCSLSSLKNYYSERRLLSEKIFIELCHLSKIDFGDLKFERLDENWGKVKGGKVVHSNF